MGDATISLAICGILPATVAAAALPLADSMPGWLFGVALIAALGGLAAWVWRLA